jgi:hypothetical protein
MMMTSSPRRPRVRLELQITLDHADLCVGYKVGAAKSADEYANLDAEDESLARWKASLGIVPGAAGAATGPKARF